MLSDYYSINHQRTEGDTTVFEVALNPDCAVYQGHFPGMPVAPGVCNIQMIKECTERIIGRPLLLEYLSQCKMTTLITPRQHPTLQVRIRILENDGTQVNVQAAIGQGEDAFITLKGTLNFLNVER
ncbi:MAG: hydroxymyristoyl-ACP dehydratase [Tannerella sp.]|jgi:3-hydroxyacyl-[acyl-carrier-protein] dehydratase|nr:hydroxymyristoyl-ACP dehydratase [Tannerella sp.]